jgi:hypothetical protein
VTLVNLLAKCHFDEKIVVRIVLYSTISALHRYAYTISIGSYTSSTYRLAEFEGLPVH